MLLRELNAIFRERLQDCSKLNERGVGIHDLFRVIEFEGGEKYLSRDLPKEAVRMDKVGIDKKFDDKVDRRKRILCLQGLEQVSVWKARKESQRK